MRVSVVLCTGAAPCAPVVLAGGCLRANQGAGHPQPSPSPSLHARGRALTPLHALRFDLVRLDGPGGVLCTFCSGYGWCNTNPISVHFMSLFCTVISFFSIHLYSIRQGMNYQSEIRILKSEMSELQGDESRGRHFEQEWYIKMVLYLGQTWPYFAKILCHG